MRPQFLNFYLGVLETLGVRTPYSRKIRPWFALITESETGQKRKTTGFGKNCIIYAINTDPSTHMDSQMAGNFASKWKPWPLYARMTIASYNSGLALPLKMPGYKEHILLVILHSGIWSTYRYSKQRNIFWKWASGERIQQTHFILPKQKYFQLLWHIRAIPSLPKINPDMQGICFQYKQINSYHTFSMSTSSTSSDYKNFLKIY